MKEQSHRNDCSITLRLIDDRYSLSDEHLDERAIAHLPRCSNAVLYTSFWIKNHMLWTMKLSLSQHMIET